MLLEECQQVFKGLKKVCKTANVLHFNSSSCLFIAESNTSNFMIGGIVSEDHDKVLSHSVLFEETFAARNYLQSTQ